MKTLSILAVLIATACGVAPNETKAPTRQSFRASLAESDAPAFTTESDFQVAFSVVHEDPGHVVNPDGTWTFQQDAAVFVNASAEISAVHDGDTAKLVLQRASAGEWVDVAGGAFESVVNDPGGAISVLMPAFAKGLDVRAGERYRLVVRPRASTPGTWRLIPPVRDIVGTFVDCYQVAQ